jgi:enoyl-CoA hydratase
VLVLTLDHADALNAVDAAMHEELSRVFDDAAADEHSDVIVLTGAGRAFCAGGDIGWMQESFGSQGALDRTAREAKRIVSSLLECEKPVICRMNGDAVGLGATVALFCDIIVAADHAKISDPHVRVGLVAGDGGAVIWPQLVGYARAKEFLLTGNAVAAPEAARIGLINYAVSPAELDARVYGFADRLAGGAVEAIRWTKAAVNVPLRQIAAASMEASIPAELMSAGLPAHQRAVEAFIANAAARSR